MRAMPQVEARAPTNGRDMLQNSTHRGRDPAPSLPLRLEVARVALDPGCGGGCGCGSGTGRPPWARSAGPAQTRYNGETAVKPPSPPTATRLRCLSPQDCSVERDAFSEDERSTAESQTLQAHVLKAVLKSEPVGHMVKSKPVGHEPGSLVCNLARVSVNRARRRTLEKGLQASVIMTLCHCITAPVLPRTRADNHRTQTCSCVYL